MLPLAGRDVRGGSLLPVLAGGQMGVGCFGESFNEKVYKE